MAEKKERRKPPVGVEELQQNLSRIRGKVVTKMSRSGGFEFPKFGFYRKTTKKPCAWNEKDKPFPVGRVELDIVTDRDAKAVGVRAGPALRLCIKENTPAPIIPVDSPDEAQKIGTEFRDCVVGGGDRKECALEKLEKFRGIKPADVRFAGMRRKKGRR